MGRILEEEKLDALEMWREKFTELRVAYMDGLEKALIEGEISLPEAVRQFASNMKWDDKQTRLYLKLVSGPDSRFKSL